MKWYEQTWVENSSRAQRSSSPWCWSDGVNWVTSAHKLKRYGFLGLLGGAGFAHAQWARPLASTASCVLFLSSARVHREALGLSSCSCLSHVPRLSSLHSSLSLSPSPTPQLGLKLSLIWAFHRFFFCFFLKGEKFFSSPPRIKLFRIWPWRRVRSENRRRNTWRCSGKWRVCHPTESASTATSAARPTPTWRPAPSSAPPAPVSCK